MANATTQVVPFSDVTSAQAPPLSTPSAPLALPASPAPHAPPPRAPPPHAPQQLAIVPLDATKNVATDAVALRQAKPVKPIDVIPDERIDPARWARPSQLEDKKSDWQECAENVFMIVLGLTDNMLAYFTYATVRAFHGRLYNIVDLHLVLLPALDIALLFFAMLGTATFAAMVALVECLKYPLFHELMNFRLFFSAMPCGLISGLVLYYSERSQLAPFITSVSVLMTIFIWCLHMRVIYNKSLNVVSRITLDMSWFLALACAVCLLVLYLGDQLHTITKSDTLGCPYAANKQMPVHVPILGKWYCASWDEKHSVIRAPVSNVPVRLACSDSFVSAFSVSIEPHIFKCPPGCLRSYNPGLQQGSGSVTGCGVYTADSSICISAIHAGILTDDGGQAVVYGRLGAASFSSCSRNSITSASRFSQEGSVSISPPGRSESSTYSLPSGGRRLIATPAVLGPDGQQVSQAFHFSAEGLAAQEYLWLKSFDRIASHTEGVQEDKPWTRIEAVVSARLAGMELEDAKMRVGPATESQLFVQPQHGQVFTSKPAQCQLRNTGVLCNEASTAMLQLDFCSKELKECPDE